MARAIENLSSARDLDIDADEATLWSPPRDRRIIRLLAQESRVSHQREPRNYVAVGAHGLSVQLRKHEIEAIARSSHPLFEPYPQELDKADFVVDELPKIRIGHVEFYAAYIAFAIALASSLALVANRRYVETIVAISCCVALYAIAQKFRRLDHEAL